MFRVLWIMCFWLALGLPVLAAPSVPINYAERIAEESRTYINCSLLEEARLACERLETARAIAALRPLKTFVHRVRGRDILYREFVIVAYDPVEQRFHDILLGMPVEVGKDRKFQPILLEAGPYQVTRLRGQSLNKMVFDVRYEGGRELLVDGAQHLLFGDPERGKKNIPYKEVLYLSTPAHLVNNHTAAAGHALLFEQVEKALAELRELQVPSRAYPKSLVGERITARSVIMFMVTEQTDMCFLRERPRPKICDVLIPKRPYLTDNQVRQAVLVEFFVNGLSAFRYMRSHANARGMLQFTNIKTKTYAGTYTVVRARYPEALLDPSFEQGTQGLVNVIKAAALLIDLELAQLPPWVRELCVTDDEFCQVIYGGAYNGGASESRKMALMVEKFAQQKKVPLAFDGFPWEEFAPLVVAPTSKLKRETRGYVQKIIDTTHFFRRLRPKTE